MVVVWLLCLGGDVCGGWLVCCECGEGSFLAVYLLSGSEAEPGCGLVECRAEEYWAAVEVVCFVWGLED